MNTLSMLAKGTILIAVVAASQIFEKYETQYDQPIVQASSIRDETWNYTLNGTDWDFANCNVASQPQAPRDLQHATNGTKRVYDWNMYMFGWTPIYHEVTIDTAGI